MSKLDDEKRNQIKNFVKSKSFLIVDENIMGRALFEKVLKDIGFSESKILMAGDTRDAAEAFSRDIPDFVVFSYGLGFDKCKILLKEHLKRRPSRLDSGFFVSSHNNSMAFVSMLLESDVDMCFTKPYTFNSIQSSLVDYFLTVVEPSKGQYKLNEGREAFYRKDYLAVLDSLSDDSGLESFFSLAQYYKGKAHFELNDLLAAEKSLLAGLSKNPLHFKCLTAICELYVGTVNYEQAYRHYKTLLENFPISPTQICNLVRVVIFEQQFEDILVLGQKMAELDDIDDFTKMNVAAGLVLACRHLVNMGDKTRAREGLIAATKFSGGKITIIKEIISLMLVIGDYKTAEAIFSKFAGDDINAHEYQLMALELHSFNGDPGSVLRQAQLMQKNGIVDRVLYEVMIVATHKIGGDQDSIQKLIAQAERILPKEGDYFRKILTKFRS